MLQQCIYCTIIKNGGVFISFFLLYIKMYTSVYLKQVIFAVWRFHLYKLEKKEGQGNIYQNCVDVFNSYNGGGISVVIPRLLCD